jgi:hypothetical protein
MPATTITWDVSATPPSGPEAQLADGYRRERPERVVGVGARERPVLDVLLYRQVPRRAEQLGDGQ